MTFTALSCPQCGGPLPRQALWRSVQCPHCKAVVTRTAETVQRADFRAALQRANDTAPLGGRTLVAGSASYALRCTLGIGTSADVFLGERLGAVRARATVKIARGGAGDKDGDGAGAAALRREAATLEALQALDGAGAVYFSQRLPQPLFAGTALEAGGERRGVLVLRYPSGCWGSLADVMRAQPQGIDARHAVWMWRRVLETLAYLHRAGWAHGDLAPEHLLVDPEQHGIRVIGWGRAAAFKGAALEAARSRDLQQLAWSMRAVLAGPHGGTSTGTSVTSHDGAPAVPKAVPAPLAALLRSVSEDRAWCATHDAEAVERALGQAADAAFGAPRFVAFDPLGGHVTAR